MSRSRVARIGSNAKRVQIADAHPVRKYLWVACLLFSPCGHLVSSEMWQAYLLHQLNQARDRRGWLSSRGCLPSPLCNRCNTIGVSRKHSFVVTIAILRQP